MIQLGSKDPEVPDSLIHEYFAKVKDLMADDFGEQLLQEDGAKVGFTPASPDDDLSVAKVQTTLKAAGFFPNGRIDGICGYRTAAAIRLFQEYVRSSGDPNIGIPDGLLGSKGLAALRRFRDEGLEADWGDHGTEHGKWIAYLNRVKEHYTDPANRSRQLRMVDNHAGASDTHTVSEWDFDPAKVHVVGVRRRQRSQSRPGLGKGMSEQKFDDIIVLLVHGMVFKFQGSTEPGMTSHEGGAPFLVQGQHDYRLGWHRGQYQALKPASAGVLVVRSKDDYVLTDADLLRPDGTEKRLEANGTINVHWAGKGVARNVSTWSEGCQVIAGSGYINHRGSPVSCADFVATNRAALVKQPDRPRKTKGAYNVLADLVAVFSDDASNRVSYMLLSEEDLALDSEIHSILDQAREHAKRLT